MVRNYYWRFMTTILHTNDNSLCSLLRNMQIFAQHCFIFKLKVGNLIFSSIAFSFLPRTYIHLWHIPTFIHYSLVQKPQERKEGCEWRQTKKKIGIKVGKPNTLLKKHYKLVKNYEIVFKYFLRVFSAIILVHLQTEFSLAPISSYAINFFLFKATKFLTFSIRRRTKEYVQNFFEW